MRFKRVHKDHVTLESVAVTDIVMNLFLFFFVTFGLYTTFQIKHESPMKVDLPKVAEGKIAGAEHVREILIQKSGQIVWNQTPITLNELKNKLAEDTDKNELIALRPDKQSSVQALVSVLDALRSSGMNNVSLQTELTSMKN